MREVFASKREPTGMLLIMYVVDFALHCASVRMSVALQ